MAVLGRKEVFIFVIFIGYTQAESPIVTAPTNGYVTIAEDFNGIICKLHIEDPDSGDNIIVSADNTFTAQYLNIVSPERGNDILVNITVNKTLDRETLESPSTIKLSISDKQHNQVTFEYKVYITDVNDNCPVFQDLPYTLEIPELSCDNGSSVYTKIKATDKDINANGRVSYSMEPKAQSNDSRVMYSQTFSIDPKTGYISLHRCLDYETNSYYQFIVMAKDSGPDGELNATAEFIIRVQDVQDKPPFFTGIPYRKTIEENVGNGATIVKINAEDGDPGVSNRVNYIITNSSCGGVFHIDSTEGDITTSGMIDRDTGIVKKESGNCIITVLAQEIETAGEVQKGDTTASTSVTVSVKDVDDNNPTFGQTVYTATVPENTPKGVPLTLRETINVIDIDQMENAKMEITLQNMDSSNCTDFTATPATIQGFGELLILVKNTSLLDYEEIKNKSIKIIATETANKSHIATAEIKIDITDVNDNNPIFNSTQFTLKVPESSSNGTSIARITAIDADVSPAYNTLSYSISGGNGRFIVDNTTGNILVNCSNCSAELDREKQNIYYMTYTAKDIDERSDSASLVIHLLDVNDNTPAFLSSSYNIIADENDQQYLNKTPLIKVEAHDDDKEGTNNSAVVYDIVSTTGTDLQNKFRITSETGAIFLTSALDYEKLTSSSGEINITVQATDKGRPTLSSSVIVTLNVQDKNDNRPKFEKTLYKANISEDASSNETHYTPVKEVLATDHDGTDRNRKLNYIITRGGSDRFKINATSGKVSVQLGAKFDRETVPNYNLTIIAIDQGYPTLTGSTSLLINVIDVNDELPKFSDKEYFAKISENAVSLSIVSNCSASDDDLNDKLEYSITNIAASDERGMEVNESLVSNYFNIYPNNGTVYVKDTLDRETAEKIILTLMVEDKEAFDPKPQTATATLTITLKDVNDNSPDFKKNDSNSFSVIENARNPTVLGTLIATDKDVNRTITYQIVKNGGSANGSFKINPNTGVLTKTGYLDRETYDMVYLKVTATDNGIPQRTSSIDVNVTILDFNDNSPKFGNFSHNVTIKEDSTNGTTVIAVNATDKDKKGPNSRITFTLDTQSPFVIDETTGIITVVQSLDRETKDTYKLHIIAKDNPIDQKEQKSTDVTVTVNIGDVNDNSPKFKPTTYNDIKIPEDKDVGSEVLTVSATDKDDGNNSVITYEIVKSLKSGLFSINENTGVVFVNSSLANKVGHYNLTIIAYDQGMPRLNGTANVEIEVRDVNSHHPVITEIPNGNEISIYECAEIGANIHTFNHTDGDFFKANKEASFRIVSEGNKTIAFNITESGVLKVKSILDVNKQPMYTFSIQAIDHGIPPLSSKVVSISVKILDINDHLPSFDKAQVILSKPENTTFNESIGTVTAHDKDKDSRMCYKIIKSNWTDYFNISEEDGDIFSLKELDHEAAKSVSFKVNVADCTLKENATHCDEFKTAEILKAQRDVRETIEVVINVEDLDDNPPVFKQNNLATGMRRNTEAGTELELNLRNNSYISDADSPQNGVLSWTFKNYGNITISPELQSKIKTNSGAKPCDDNIKHIFCVTKNGTIVNNKFFSEDLSGYFILTVLVADKAGSDTADITIYLISDAQIVTMTIRNNKEMVASFKDDLLRKLSAILGYTAVFDSLEDHKENGVLNSQSSDLKFHVVEKESQAVLSGKAAIELFDKQANSGKMVELQNTYNVMRVSQQSMSESDTDAGSKKLTFILVAVSAAEALIITIIIFIALSARNKFRRKLKAAVINTPDMEMHAHEQKEAAIPGSNLYSKMNNPLLNADIDPTIQDSNIDSASIASYDDINLDENVVGDHNTVYDRMEEREVTMDMYNDDTLHSVSSEDLLSATLNMHALRKSKESLDNISNDDGGPNDTYDRTNTAAAFINEAFAEDLESTEI